MSWDDTQTSTDSITYTEWNAMVSYIKSAIESSGVVDATTLKIGDVAVTATAAEINVLDGIPSTLTYTELGYVDGVTSGIQTQLNGKASSSHSHVQTDITDLDHDAVKLRGVGLDSTVASPSDGNILVYRTAGSDWILEAKPVGGNPALNDITDVDITDVADNEMLAYNAATSTWINQTAAEVGVEPTVTKGNLSTTTSGITVGTGTGAVIGSGTTIDISTASASANGLLSSTDWSTFNGKAGTTVATSSANGLLSSTDWSTFNGKAGTTIATSSANGLLSSTDWSTFNAKATTTLATSSANGILSSTDWSTFNGKLSSVSGQQHSALTGMAYADSGHTGFEPTVTKGNLSTTTVGVTVSSGTGAVIGSGTTINIATAATDANGLLSSTDWNTFNSKAGTTVATSSANGLLSSTDWSTFNSKEPTVTKGNLSTTTSGITIGSGSGAVIGSGTTVDISTASASVNGILSSTDWTTFNSKAGTALATSSANGLLSSTDWSTFNAKATTTIATSSANGLLSSTDWSTFNTKLSDVVNDTTPQLGGNLDMNQKSLEYDPTPTEDHTWSGEVITATAGENVTIGQVCYFKSDGKFWLADSDAEATSKGLLAMATGTINQNATGLFLLKGFFRDDTFDYTVGAELYIHTTAWIPTGTKPSGSTDIVRIVGYAYSADIVYFDPDTSYVEVA